MSSAPEYVITELMLMDSSAATGSDCIVIYRTFGTDVSANLDRKEERYLCYKRKKLETCTESTPVLVDIRVWQSGDTILSSYTPVVFRGTSSRKEKKKSKVYGKFATLNSADRVVVKIVICNQGECPPEPFTFIGQINSLGIYIKTARHCRFNASDRPSTPPTMQIPSPTYRETSTISFADFALSNIPIKFNRIEPLQSFKATENLLASICDKTPGQVYQEYDYEFAVEDAVLHILQ